MHSHIVAVAKKLDRSSRYQRNKAFFRDVLHDVDSPYKIYFDSFMIFLIVFSTSLVILNKTEEIPSWLVKVDLYAVTMIFSLEYLLRLWVAHDMHTMVLQYHQKPQSLYWRLFKTKLHYMFSLPALIDFIAIFPNFRIMRLLKLYHYMSGTSSLFDALLKKRFEFIFLGYMLFGITFTFGSIFYLLEFGINKNLDSYLDALYWALVTISTVGYGDIAPVTSMGQLISMFGIVFGIAMISFVTSVMVSAFSERFDTLRNQDNIKHSNKMKNVVIIHGYGHLGATIARKLKQNTKYEPVIIESDTLKAKAISEEGYKVIHADGSSASIIQRLYHRDNISAMLTLTSSDIDNIYFILNAKSVYAKSVVYARMNHGKLQLQYEATKVNGSIEPHRVINEKAEAYLSKYAKAENKSVTFLGYIPKSRAVCQALQAIGIETVVYEVDETHLLQAQEDGCNTVIAMPNTEHIMPTLENTIVVCAMKDDAINVYYSITLRANGFSDKIVALSDSKEDNRKLFLAGVSKIFDMYEESANQFIEMIEHHDKEKKI
ncbi:MAG: NAD-binding protein [Sulfurovum sp.]|nr:NAD-binding protein [Sulfurovum sp.]